MRLVRKAMLGLGLASASMFTASPAHAWYEIYYVAGGFDTYCDNGDLIWSVGNAYGPIDSIVYHTGEPPC